MNFLCKSPYGHILSFLLCKHLGVDWLGHMAGVYVFEKLPHYFSKLYYLTFPPAVWESDSSSVWVPGLAVIQA